MLPRIIAESGDKYIYGLSKPDYVPLVKGTVQNEHDVNSRITDLSTADKIIAYRIIESGIIYKEIKKTNQSRSDSLTRVAQTVLKFRVEDAKSGEIVSLENLENISQDKISKDVKSILESYHYKHYRFGYPATYGNSRQLKLEGKENTSKKSSDSTGDIIFAITLIGLVGIMLGARDWWISIILK